MRSTRTIAAVALTAAALAGCATTEPAAVLAGGPRMIDLYRGAAAEPWPSEGGVSEAARAVEPSLEEHGPSEAPQAPEGDAPKAAVVEATCRWWGLRWPCEAPAVAPAPACACGDAPAYTRTAANELELLFPRLPNPDVFIYVPAHLATELRIPVPGYTTAVPLYDRVEYALPGEGDGAARESDALHGPSEARPGVGPEEAPSGAGAEEVESGSEASPDEAPLGPNPEEAQPDGAPEEVRPGANAEEAESGAGKAEAELGASPQEARPGASPEEGPPDSSPVEARPGANPDVWTGASPVEARPHAGMEAVP